MAQYTATIYADDCYAHDWITGIDSRGEIISATANIEGQFNNGGVRTTRDISIDMHFPPPVGYAKKRIVACRCFYKAVARNGWFSGSIGPNSSPKYLLDTPYSSVWKGQLYVDDQREDIYNIPTGQYHQLSVRARYSTANGAHGFIGLGIGVVNGYYANVYYTGGATISINAGGDSRPYAIYTMEDVTPYVRNCYPQSGFINEKVANTFGWEFTYDSKDVFTTLKQKSAKFRWRPYGASNYTEIPISGATQSYTVPANTFSTSQIQWQVVVTSDDDISSTSSDWYTLTTVDSITAAEPVSPKSIYVDGNMANVFTWENIVDTGSSPSKSELQYSQDSGNSWIDLATITGPALSTIIPKDTLPAGELVWRVRTYNSDGVVGTWSNLATIIVRSAPPAPAIASITVSPRPTVYWQAVGQQAYQVRAGSYDSGMIYGTEKEYKVREFLSDGDATISVRIQNAFGIWSTWATAVVNINNNPLPDIDLQAKAERFAIRLTWHGSAAIYYVYRDKKLIGKTNEQSYVDNLAFGIHTYQVRSVTGDAYGLSELVKARLCIHTPCIAEYGTWDWQELRFRRSSRPYVQTQYTSDITFQHYAGRALPLAEIGEALDISYSFDFAALDKPMAERMRSLLAKLVVLKDPREGVCIGVLEQQGVGSDCYGWDISYTLRAVDHQEVVTYDV